MRFLSLILALTSVVSVQARAQDLELNPTRPTIANSASIQESHVLQIETGYDAFPQSVPGNQQTADTLITYTPFARWRADLGWTAFTHQTDSGEITDGIGPLQIGGKVELKKENYHRPLPGFALQYELQLPTASQKSLQNFGQQATLMMNHHYGLDGVVDLILDGSIVQSDCQSKQGCSYGGQQSFALSYHAQKKTRLYAEIFAQNVSQSNAPPGTYVFTGFYRQVSNSFGIDGGMRFGVTNHSASLGTTVGLVFGKKL